jgi:hypothetical protein
MVARKKLNRKKRKPLTKLQKLGRFLESNGLSRLLYKIVSSLKVLVLVGLINALFTYCFWSLSSRVTALEKTSQETLLVIEETMKEVSAWSKEVK